VSKTVGNLGDPLSTYDIRTGNNVQHSIRFLGVPIVISLVFCFSFVLMHAQSPKQSPTASASAETRLSKAPTSLPVLHVNEENPLPTITTNSLDASGLSAAYSSTRTASPQSAGSADTKLQGNSNSNSESQQLLNAIKNTLNSFGGSK
jgi:hypothetical protein